MSYFNQRDVVKFLRRLKENETKDFEKFLHYKGSSNVAKMYAVLRRKHPDYAIANEALYKAVRPKKDYNDGVFRVWVSELTKLVKEYIAYQEFQSNKHLQANVLSMGLVKRAAKDEFEKTLKKNEKLYAPDTALNANQYYAWQQQVDIHYQYITAYHHWERNTPLEKAFDLHNYAFIVQNLKYLVTMRNRERVGIEVFDYRSELDFLTYLQHFSLDKHPMLEAYRRLLLVFRAYKDHAVFQDFKTFLIANEKAINATEYRQMTTFAVNICLWNIKEGRSSFIKDRFELTKIVVEGGYILLDGVFPTYHFRNVMIIAVEAGEIKWAEQFFKEYLPKTREIDRHNLQTLNKAYLHFAKGEYEEQRLYMREMMMKSTKEKEGYIFTDKFNEIAFRLLELKTYYIALPAKPKPKVLASFRTELSNFRQYLRRKEDDLNANYIASCTNFSRGLGLLVQHLHGQRGIGKNLKKAILALGPMIELTWLLGEVRSGE